ncbi:MAG: alpha/beta hydrolase [Betaproteobacteria bacterium]
MNTGPRLLVRGGLSDVLSEAGAREFLALCPRSEYVEINNAAHMVAGDRNDIFANAVVEFLSRVTPVTGEPERAPHALHPRQHSSSEDLVDEP